MIRDNTPLPKVWHSKLEVGKRTAMRKLIGKFAKEVSGYGEKVLLGGLEGWDNPDNLLDMRKILVKQVEEGMLERKDQEVQIAFYAALVWFNRLSEEKRLEVLEELTT